jgi:ATP-binding cassette subfamily F protein uup
VVATPLPTPAVVAPAAKTRKLSFKEQRELDGLPAAIAALEDEQRSITEALADGSLFAKDNAKALALTSRAAQIDDELMAALERWETLGA